MRTYLQLVKRLHQECGIGGEPPASVAGHRESSQQQRLCDWIADAWIAILELHPNWKFRRRSTSFPTTAGQSVYTSSEVVPIQNGQVGRWIPTTFRVYHTASGFSSERHLDEDDYDDWLDTYQFGSQRSIQAPPLSIAVTPDNGLALGPTPPAGFTVLGDFYLAPTRLMQNGDVPDLPPQYDSMGIVHKAMMDDGGFEAASEIYQRAARGYAEFIDRLRKDQLPAIEICLGT